MEPAPGRYHPRIRLQGFDYADPDQAYFVTICTHQRRPVFADPRLADQVVSTLHWLRDHRGTILYAYCVMPDHLHLLLRPGSPTTSMGEIVGSLKSFTTRQSWTLGYTGPLWQQRFYDHIVRKSEDGWEIAAYILNNPVRKGPVAVPDEYPYSATPDPL